MFYILIDDPFLDLRNVQILEGKNWAVIVFLDQDFDWRANFNGFKRAQ